MKEEIDTSLLGSSHFSDGAGMSGTFPSGLTHLPFLQYIHFAVGTMGGPLPKEIDALSDLRGLRLQGHRFSGEIPAEWYQMTNLTFIDISYNQVGGTVSPRLGELMDLLQLRLDHNQLSPGPIPSELGLLSNLEVIDLAGCQLEGSIPAEFGSLTRLHDLSLHDNSLTGTLPSFENITNLFMLNVANNPELGGTIPDDLYQNTRLISLELSSCNFTGTLSPKIEQLQEIATLRLNDNALSGELPALPVNMLLHIVELQLNRFTGSVAQEVCDQYSSPLLTTPRLRLSALAADCADSVTGEEMAEVQCTCCTICCDPSGLCNKDERRV